MRDCWRLQGDALPLRGARWHAAGSKAGVESRTGRRGEQGVGSASFDQTKPFAVSSQAGRASPPDREAGSGGGTQADARLGACGLRQDHAGRRVGGGAGSRGAPVAWLSLDGGDNDPVRFLSYLVASLRTLEEGFGEVVLASLRTPEPPPSKP